MRSLGGSIIVAVVMLAGPAYPQSALRQELTTASTNVPAGGLVTVQNVITNISDAPLTGQFINTATVDRGMFTSVTSSNPAITFSRVPGSSPGADSFRTITDNVTLPPRDRIFITYNFFTPFDAPQETRVRFQSTVTGFSGQVASGLIFFVIQGTAPRAPQLDIAIRRQAEGGGLSTGRISYEVEVTNVGTGPTTGPVQVMVTFGAPFALNPENFGATSLWSMTGPGQFTALERPTLVEGQTFFIPPPLFEFDTAVRGIYTLTVVASGGAPRVEKVDAASVEERASGPITVPTFESISGRVRE